MLKTNVKDYLKEFDEIERSMALYRSCPEYSTPDSIVNIVKEMMDSQKYEILHH